MSKEKVDTETLTIEPMVEVYVLEGIDVTEFFEESPPLQEMVSLDMIEKLLTEEE